MFLLELKFASQLVCRFKYTKKVGRDSWRFACPICGDSKKSKKTRGNLFPHNGHLFFKCFNCGVSKSFKYFLKEIDAVMYDEFLLESIRGTSKRNDLANKNDVEKALKESKTSISDRFDKTDVLNGLKPIKLCANPIQKVVTDRNICLDTFGKYIFFSDCFLSYIKKFQPEKFNGEIKQDYPRIAIVSFDEFDRPIFVQFRKLLSNDTMPKYMTLKFKDVEKIFGLDRINKSLLTYITEGPFDSMFLDNAVAVAGSDLLTSIEKYGKITKPCFIFDNEPRSPIIVKKIENVLSIGYKVVLYDTHNTFKDLNDMVLGGINVKEMVERRTFSGIRAKLEFNKWKKV